MKIEVEDIKSVPRTDYCSGRVVGGSLPDLFFQAASAASSRRDRPKVGESIAHAGINLVGQLVVQGAGGYEPVTFASDSGLPIREAHSVILASPTYRDEAEMRKKRDSDPYYLAILRFNSDIKSYPEEYRKMTYLDAFAKYVRKHPIRVFLQEERLCAGEGETRVCLSPTGTGDRMYYYVRLSVKTESFVENVVFDDVAAMADYGLAAYEAAAVMPASQSPRAVVTRHAGIRLPALEDGVDEPSL